MSRNSIILTGLLGLVGAVFITAFSLFAVIQIWVPIIITTPYYGWGIFLFLAIFSIFEMPIMIFGIRRIAASPDPRSVYIALATNVIYVLFAAVYAMPHILLTGWFPSGLALAGLSIIRLMTSIIFLPQGK